MALWRAIDDPGRAARAVAILTLVGALNLPIIRFLGRLGGTPCTSRLPSSASDGPTIYPAMLYPLLVMGIAFALLAITMHAYAMRTELMRRRIRTLNILEAERLDSRVAA